MKRKINILIFFLAVFKVLTFNVQADWYKYSNNPVVTPQPGKNINAPEVIYENNKFKMWYGSFANNRWDINYAESNDGKIWNTYPNPVVTPYPGEIGATEPTIIHTDKYYMWFNGFTIAHRYRIRYATSTDGINWITAPQPVLLPTPNRWDNFNITNPSVLFVNDKYQMWYSAGPPWRIGFATSNNGIQWTKYGNSPLNLPYINFADGPKVVYYNNQYHLYYHVGDINNKNAYIYYLYSSDGINWSCLTEGCKILETGTDGYDKNGITAPGILKINNDLFMYYGSNNGTNWQISLAKNNPFVNLSPIIIVPGFLASWNKNGLIYNQTVDYNEWNLLPFVNEYNGLIDSLSNIGYIENKNIFVFPYDWRASIDQTSENLKQFIDSNVITQNQNEKVNLIGHSLGGLVSRIYTQNYPATVNKLITVGSPHKGTPQAYKPLSAGELDQDNTFLWLAEKLILILNKNGLESDKDTINRLLPSLFDLFPTYNFLKKNNNLIDINSLLIENHDLRNYPLDEFDIKDRSEFIYGNRGNNTTPYVFEIENQTILDKLKNNYLDGHPINLIKNNGDYQVSKDSGKGINGYNSFELLLDHGELIYKKEGISKILDLLNISFTPEMIIEGKSTKISPSLIFLIKSPVNIKISHNNNIYQDEAGLLFIPEIKNGNYRLEISGKSKGKYSIIIGQVSQSGDYWSSYESNINIDNPYDYNKVLNLDINLENLHAPITDVLTLFDELIYLFNSHNEQFKSSYVVNPSVNTQKAKQLWINNRYPEARSTLLLINKQIFQILKQTKNTDLLELMYKLEILYEKALSSYSYNINTNKIQRDTAKIKSSIDPLAKYLLFKKNNGNNVNFNVKILDEILSKITSAEKNYEFNNKYVDILYQSINYLLQIVK